VGRHHRVAELDLDICAAGNDRLRRADDRFIEVEGFLEPLCGGWWKRLFLFFFFGARDGETDEKENEDTFMVLSPRLGVNDLSSDQRREYTTRR